MAQIVVIGAGAVGLACAYHLRRDGHDVLVVDPAPLAAKASGHNAGWLIPSMSTPVPGPGLMLQAARWMLRRDSPLSVSPSPAPAHLDFLARMLRNTRADRFRAGSATLASLSATALASFDELAAEGVEFEMHAQPLTMLFTDPHKVDVRVGELALLDGKLPGFSWRHLDPEELAGTAPRLTERVVAAIESRGDRSVDPRSFVEGLAAACRRSGVEIRLGASARLESPHLGSPIVRVDGEELRPDRTVVAAGVWSGRVVAGLGVRLALEAGKGYGYDFPVTADAPANPLYLAEAKVAITPLDSAVRAAGMMGFGGIDERVHPRRAAGLLASLGDYFTHWPAGGPEADDAPEPWVGLRPMTPDGVPMIGPLRRHQSVVVATGHAMLGIGLAPVTGRLVADLIGRRVHPAAIPSLLPERFARR